MGVAMLHPHTMERIRRLHREGKSQKEIAITCGIVESTVYKYVNMSEIEFLDRKQKFYQNQHSQKMNGKTNMIGSKDQLCWHCQNACGGCAWSRGLEPVDGWKADITYIPEPRGNEKKMTKGYLVLECPEFIRDECEV